MYRLMYLGTKRCTKVKYFVSLDLALFWLEPGLGCLRSHNLKMRGWGRFLQAARCEWTGEVPSLPRWFKWMRSGGSWGSAKVGGDGDVEVLVVVGDTSGGRGVDVPALQRAANDRVAGRVDNRDVGDTGVGSADVDDHGDLLAGGVFLDIVLVVGKLVTLAEPDVALGGLVVALRLGDLKLTLDVAVVVRLLVVVDLLTAGGGHGSAGHTGLGRGDETVAVDGGSKSRKDDEGRLHFGGVFRLE